MAWALGADDGHGAGRDDRHRRNPHRRRAGGGVRPVGPLRRTRTARARCWPRRCGRPGRGSSPARSRGVRCSGGGAHPRAIRRGQRVRGRAPAGAKRDRLPRSDGAAPRADAGSIGRHAAVGRRCADGAAHRYPRGVRLSHRGRAGRRAGGAALGELPRGTPRAGRAGGGGRGAQSGRGREPDVVWRGRAAVRVRHGAGERPGERLGAAGDR